MVKDVTTTEVTVMATVPQAAPTQALIVAVFPAMEPFTAVTKPELFTVATLVPETSVSDQPVELLAASNAIRMPPFKWAAPEKVACGL